MDNTNGSTVVLDSLNRSQQINELIKIKYPNGKICSSCKYIKEPNAFYPIQPGSVELRPKCRLCTQKQESLAKQYLGVEIL